MPIFDYKCASCGSTTEKLVKQSEISNIVLCQCGQVAERVQFSPDYKSGLQFVGGGWPGQEIKLADRKKSGDILDKPI